MPGGARSTPGAVQVAPPTATGTGRTQQFGQPELWEITSPGRFPDDVGGLGLRPSFYPHQRWRGGNSTAGSLDGATAAQFTGQPNGQTNRRGDDPQVKQWARWGVALRHLSGSAHWLNVRHRSLVRVSGQPVSPRPNFFLETHGRLELCARANPPSRSGIRLRLPR